MWTCPKCSEEIEDQFDACWKCAGPPDPIGLPMDARTKTTLRQIVWVVSVTVLLGFAVLAYLFLHPPAYRFAHKDASYHAEFGRACDVILANHRLGTNEFLEIPTTDALLPKIVRDLQPRRIVMLPHHVWIQMGVSRADGFGITWKQDEILTNTWSLSIAGEMAEALFTTNRQHTAGP